MADPNLTKVSSLGFDMKVTVDGIPRPVMYVEGWKCIFPAMGKQFKIVVKNNNSWDALCVVEVDGEQVETGLVTILAAESSAEFSGWRKTASTILPFVFTETKKDANLNNNTMAKGTNDTEVGLIAAIFYRTEVAGGHVGTHSYNNNKAHSNTNVLLNNEKKNDVIVGSGAEQVQPIYWTDKQYVKKFECARLEIRYNALMEPPAVVNFKEESDSDDDEDDDDDN